MSFLGTLGYRFKLPGEASPDGAIILASGLPRHQLTRRRIDPEGRPYLEDRLFDPQLYLAGLGAHEASTTCTYLSSYSWFGVETENYDSGEQKQSEWKSDAERDIANRWPSRAPVTSIPEHVKACIDLQMELGCSGVILPSPLCVTPTSSYEEELRWLDAGLEYAQSIGGIELPVFATVALSDVCLRSIAPTESLFLSGVADAVSSREVDGVYIVVELASEPEQARQCGNANTLESVLFLTHAFARDAELIVGVNFLGAFGAACRGAGADFWCSAWYKSLIRLRMADRATTGRAYPSYWTRHAALDVHLETDFDLLAASPVLNELKDETAASRSLLDAAAAGRQARDVPGWAYAQSNVESAREHFYHSCLGLDDSLEELSEDERVNAVATWLDECARRAQMVDDQLGRRSKTSTAHVAAWRDAFARYRQSHGV
ncbi:MAG: hypothetical protein R3F20_03505 [Planctomycetota bacterium]